MITSKLTKKNPPVSRLYQNYVLGMLTLVYVFNFIDRQVLVILQESIKKELLLSDTQLGLLSGFTFAIFYVTLGIPIARIADKGNRRNVVTISLGIWSLMTAFSGLARNFIQLLLARIGVGVGEAGGSPPAHAMISDYFPPEKRSTALSVYSTGIYFGVLIGFLMGGYLNQHLGWRTAFFVLGIPGLIFSLLFYTTVKEPSKGATDAQAMVNDEAPAFGSVLRYLFSLKVFVFLAIATALHVFCIYGLLNWAPSFLSRIHGMKNVDIGVSLGLIYGLGGAAGTYAGGYLTDHFGKKNRRYYLKIPAYAVLLSMVFISGTILLQSLPLTLFCLGACAFLQSMYLGPSLAVAHSLVVAPMRAMTSAILFFVLNFFGQGFGPLIVGLISDALKPQFGMESLRWALSILLIMAFGAAMMFFAAAKKLQTAG